jgi:hypothetical protein
MASTSMKSNGTRTAEKKSIQPVSGKSAFSKSTVSVAQRAYDIYQKRVSSGKPGDQIGDWLQAESEIHSHR